MPVVQRRTYELPPVNLREVLRYAKAGQDPLPPATAVLLQEVLTETASFLTTGRVCFLTCSIRLEALASSTQPTYPLSCARCASSGKEAPAGPLSCARGASSGNEAPADSRIFFGDFLSVESADLAKNLAGCSQAILFGATIGIEVDRRIAKYGLSSPTKALFFQAVGAERIEALCDAFCRDMAANSTNMSMRPRFSPGYGDLPLEVQRDLFGVLDAPRQIGLTLNESLQMSPSKSVTAIVGQRLLPQK